MKYANYKYYGKNLNNLGDQAQLLAVDNLYEEMGILLDDIVYIDSNDVQAYDKEPVLLPVLMPLNDYHEKGIAGMFSDKVTPVFLGFTMIKDSLLDVEIEFLKKHEPVGCRDERTYKTLSDFGVNAYLSGCLTATWPRRKENLEKQSKVFIIDHAKGLKDYIPYALKKNAVKDTHIFYERFENPKLVAKNRYDRYKNEARLVITSLLHCASPCMAMGIPVILTKDKLSYRFGWLDTLLPIYSPEEYGEINWNPNSVVYENHKKTLRELFEKRMKGLDASNEIQRVHKFYMNRKRTEYVVDNVAIIDFIKENWLDYDAEYEYSIWGLHQISEVTYNYISKNYPKARLMNIYDLRVGTKFKGISAKHPNELVAYPNETVFVTTMSAAKAARDLFEEINKPTNLYKTVEAMI